MKTRTSRSKALIKTRTSSPPAKTAPPALSSQLPAPRSSGSLPGRSGADVAVELLPRVLETAVNVIEVNIASRDRRHEREIALTAAREQARHWDAEATRRHQAFREALKFAQQLAHAGHVAEAVQIMAQAGALLPTGLQAAPKFVSQPLLPPGGAS